MACRLLEYPEKVIKTMREFVKTNHFGRLFGDKYEIQGCPWVSG